MSWIPGATTGQGLGGTLALVPPLADAFQAYRRAIWSQPHLPLNILELCRLRLAQLHRCSEQFQTRNIDAARAGVDDDKVSALPNWHKDERFSPAERACLEFAEVYYMDPNQLSDAQADAVKQHVGEPGLVALVQSLGVFDAQCRLALLLDLT